MTLRVLDLFSGIGGFSLGLERAGFKTVAFCEIDPFCRRVLAKHWPSVPCYDDIKELTATRLAADGIAADVLCGGFPCQDISLAGAEAGAGLDGSRSALWWEYHRLIAEIRPRYAIIENVPALRGRGLDRVLGSLAEIGFDAEWHCIPAAAVGAEHRRDRVWIVAHPNGSGFQGIYKQSWEEHLQSAQRAIWRIRKATPRVRGNFDGVSFRVDRIRSLGNAVVPQIPEIIGRAILAAESATRPIAVERVA